MLPVLQAAWRGLELAVGWIFSSSWLPPTDFRLYKWLFVPGFGYGAVMVGFALFELLRPQQRRPWNRAAALSGTYLLFAGKLGLYSVIVTPAFRKAWLALGLPSAHLDRVLPWPVYMLVTVLVVTFVAYWAHRLMHRIPFFWQIHKIHHSATNLNWSTVYHKHFLETLLQTPMHLVVVLGLGTDLVAPFGIIFKTIDVLAHANVKLDLGRWTYLITTPQAHRIHHSTDPRHFDTNFGNTFMIWDLVFGTFHYDPKAPPTAYGIDEPVPLSLVQQQLLPFVWVGRVARRAWNRRWGRSPAVRGPAPEG